MAAKVSVTSALASIRSDLGVAGRALHNMSQPDSAGFESLLEEKIARAIRRAFYKLMMLAECEGLSGLFREIRRKYLDAEAHQGGFSAHDTDEYDNEFVVQDAVLSDLLVAFEAVYDASGKRAIQKDLTDILRNMEYVMADPACFGGPPQSESEVHARAEALLRCIFPDVLTKPPIPKPIKGFVPDSGVPSIRTLVEYKFVASADDCKRVADEILADTGGYTSADWDRHIFLIYETQRFKSETQWNGLLDQCGAADRASAIVIRGEQHGASKKRPAKGGAPPIAAP